VVEYEALILGLEASKKDANYQAGGIWRFRAICATSKRFLSNKASKNEGMYKNQVWDMIDNFYEAFNIFYCFERV
jgi:hypothetical protein